MNTDWINFLKSNGASFADRYKIQFTDNPEQSNNTITPITHLAVIKISGKDASQFLQGQLTCNVNELTESNSFFSAFCNAKGRAITTLLILKNKDDFIILVPEELTEKVLNKLKMYVLRSDVKLVDVSNDFCLIGINTELPGILQPLPENSFSVSLTPEITIKFPASNPRFLIITPAASAPALWNKLRINHIAISSDSWLYQDISSGIPWLNLTSSEQYIPQMLNIDKLGGISFNKGCYTGQEIIARTHYLGKAKRELFTFECHSESPIDEKSQILTEENQQTIGSIINSQCYQNNHRILAVMPVSDTNFSNLVLNNLNQAKLKLINI